MHWSVSPYFTSPGVKQPGMFLSLCTTCFYHMLCLVPVVVVVVVVAVVVVALVVVAVVVVAVVVPPVVVATVVLSV